MYCDPVWATASPDGSVDAAAFVAGKKATREDVIQLHPRWEEADVDIELATLADWDPDTAYFLGGRPVLGFLPTQPVVPSLVQPADPSFLIGAEDAAHLRRNHFEVRTVTGAGRTIHRDDFDGFMRSLDGWI